MEKECQPARPKTSKCQRLTIQLVIPSASGDAIDDSLSRTGSSIFFLDDSEPACYERVSSLELQEKTVLEKTNTTLAFDAPKQAQASLLKKLRSLFIKTNRVGVVPFKEDDIIDPTPVIIDPTPDIMDLPSYDDDHDEDRMTWVTVCSGSGYLRVVMVHPSPRVDPENSLYPTSLADNKLPDIPEETFEEMMDVLASDVEMPPKKSLWKRLKTIFRWKKNATVKARLGGREWETNSLKKHLTKPSASDLLRQQQNQLLENRLGRAEFSQGGGGESAAKLVTLKKLRMKRSGLTNKDPNSVKRNRSNGTDITARVEKNLSSPNGVSYVLIGPFALYVRKAGKE
ncbi:hypothetical protein DPEC_G00112590 [Dallia pectoralis]|uniref:Uncharacterized protein n=1 Tax=Dallia pectoralis TaxID=75939 RepID=A0ACC2GTP9_DALPE|nr:hypothetical protein DPEC_G00112590 [Dallia pectoralis]